MTEAEAHATVMRAVVADRDRSVEKAVELGIKAGIALERERVRMILSLRGPSARGIEQIVVQAALNGSKFVDVENTVRFLIDSYESEVVARSRRAEFRLIGDIPSEEACKNRRREVARTSSAEE
jgi:hypothetical protein